MQTVEAVEHKLQQTVLQEKDADEAGNVERLKEIWSVASQLGAVEVNDWFSKLVVGQFRETAHSILK